MPKYTKFKNVVFNVKGLMRHGVPKGHAKRINNKEAAHDLFSKLLDNICYQERKTKLHDGLFLLSGYIGLFCNIRHYFVENGVADFCIDCVKEIGSEYYSTIPGEEVSSPFPDKIVDCVASLFHFPINEQRRSIMHLSFPDWGPERVIFITDGNAHATLGVEYDHSFDLEKGREIVHLIYGLSMYIEAFPDAVTKHDEGVVLKKNEYKITRSKTLNRENQSAKSPHYRRGHFRTLNHPRFKERGKVIFIKGIFVKGSAYDIKENA